MKKKKVWRYYCEYCKKSNCSGGAMSKHEKHCTMNPNRACGICKDIGNDPVPMSELLAMLPDPETDIIQFDCGGEYKTYAEGYIDKVKKAIEEVREVTDNCPVCIFAALRQKGIHIHETGFDLTKELSDYWSEVNAMEAQRDAEASLYA